MREFYLCSEKQIYNLINDIFINFEIHSISVEKIKKNNFTNQNILLIVSEDFLENLNSSFFSNNNVVVFCSTNKSFKNKTIYETKIFDKHININKFRDEVTTFFTGKPLNCEDIKLLGEKIINNKTKKEIFLTTLEKDIMIALIDQKHVKKEFLFEGILKIKKDTETKTVESHLTRIRNKLLKINSKLKIVSKSDKVFLSS